MQNNNFIFIVFTISKLYKFLIMSLFNMKFIQPRPFLIIFLQHFQFEVLFRIKENFNIVMGLQTSTFSTLIAGNTIDERYDIYKIKKLANFEYFKVYDLLEFSEKYVLLNCVIFILEISGKSL